MARFLKRFVHEVSRPIIPDGRQHIEYVPTQVLTEYLRWVPETEIDGIAFPSSQTQDMTYVLFFGPEAVADKNALTQPKKSAPFPDFDEVEEPTFTLAKEDVELYEVERAYSGRKVTDLFH